MDNGNYGNSQNSEFSWDYSSQPNSNYSQMGNMGGQMGQMNSQGYGGGRQWLHSNQSHGGHYSNGMQSPQMSMHQDPYMAGMQDYNQSMMNYGGYGGNEASNMDPMRMAGGGGNYNHRQSRMPRMSRNGLQRP